MRKASIYLHCAAVVLPFIAGCARQTPNVGGISEDTFVRYYADKLIVEEESSLRRLDTALVRKRVDSLDRAYGILPEQLRQTILEYKTDVPKWREFYDRVSKRLDSLQRQSPAQSRPSAKP